MIRGLVDAHLHLQHEAFASDVPGVLARAKAAGVERLASCGTRPGDWDALLALSRAHAEVAAFFGVHPWFAGEARGEWLRSLESCLDAVPSGVGEAGLDRTPRGAPADVQEKVLRAQLELARRKERPLSLHCVRAFGPLLELLKEAPPPPFLLHAYGGSAESVGPFTRLGAYFSFAPFNLEGARPRAVEALRAVALDRLLLESDAPDAPQPPCSEPALLADHLETAARLRGMDAAELAGRCRENARRLFGPHSR